MAQILYWTVYADSVADYANDATDAAKVAAGQDSTGSSLPSGQHGSQTFTGGTATVDASTAASGLTAGTRYRIAWTIYDDVATTYGGGTGATYVVFSAPFSALAADDGSYTITGNDVTVRANRKITADDGAYAITGNDAALRVGRVLIAAAGSYTLSGQTADLTYTPATGYSLSLAAGNYTLSGQDATLRVGRKLTAAAGSYVISGQDATVTYVTGYALTCDAGEYSLTGQAATFKRGYILTADDGVYAISGKATTLRYSGAAQPVKGLPTWYYNPGNLPMDVPAWLARELMSVSRATYGAAPIIQMQVQYAEPAKPRDGMVVLADGSTWDPGSGAGIYARISGAWVQL